MTADYLNLLGVQQWLLRPEVSLGQQISERKHESDSSSAVEQNDSSSADQFHVYAAVSLRNENSQWLWVIDQSSLTAEELKLLDKILVATGSEWQEIGIADGYISSIELKELMHSDIQAVVLFGREHADFFRGLPVFVTAEIAELIDDPEKKRQTWQGLKKLMQV